MQKRFWLKDEFIDEQASKISVYAQVVYMCMCRHSNRQGITFIGARKIAAKMGIHKDTVFKARKQLKVVGLVAHLKNKGWSVSAGGVVGPVALSGRSCSPKGINYIKEEKKLTVKEKKRRIKILKDLRKTLQKKKIIKAKK